MNNKQVFLSSLVNKFSNQNNSNDAKKIQEKATGNQNINTSRNSLNIPFYQNSNGKSASKNSVATNELASAGLTAATGIPKEVSDQIVKSKLGQEAINYLKKKNLGLRLFDRLTGGSKKEEEEEPQEGTFTNLKVSMKVIKATLIAMPSVLLILVFCCLFLGASQIFINSINLGMADSLNNEKLEEKIESSEDDWDDEITDDHENLGYNYNIDVYLLNDNGSNYVQIANEADLSELKDFYGNAIYESADTIENVDMNMVYNFYYKLYYIYKHYNSEAYNNVKLDLPLLMATLSVYTKDRAIIFGSNTIGYDSEKMKEEHDRFKYDTVHNYVSTPTKGEYDIEVLAQHMVSYQAKESCVDSSGKEVKSNTIRDQEIGTQVLVCEENETYKVTEAKYAIDEEKYREFLPEFLEKKYFLNSGDNSQSSGDSSNGSDGSGIIGGDFELCSLTKIGDKYYKTTNPQTKNCKVSGFDDNDWGLEPTFYKNVMSLIEEAKSHGCDAAIISGHRTYEKQEYLYNCFLTGACNNGNMAAAPGYSNHEYGLAADLQYIPYTSTCLNYYHTNASRFGLDFPLLYHSSFPEDWHIEPVNIIIGSP